MSLGDILGNAASGGLLGLLGPFLTEGIGVVRGHFEHKRALEMLRLQTEAKNAEAAGAIAQAREAGAAAAFTASITADAATQGESRWVKDLRGATRPALTWTSLVASILCGALGIENQLTLALNAYTGMTIAWWFGQRAIDRSGIAWQAGKFNARVVSTPTK